LLQQFLASGKTKAEFSSELGIGKSTLDRWMQQSRESQPLVRVKVKRAPEPVDSFVIVLGNGRRIESGWNFGDGDLARLIQVVEAV
jgi:hypothetical protein